MCRFIWTHFGRTTIEIFEKKLAVHQYFFRVGSKSLSISGEFCSAADCVVVK